MADFSKWQIIDDGPAQAQQQDFSNWEVVEPEYSPSQTVDYVAGKYLGGVADAVDTANYLAKQINPMQLGGPQLFGLNPFYQDIGSDATLRGTLENTQIGGRGIIDANAKPQNVVEQYLGNIAEVAPSLAVPGAPLKAGAKVLGAEAAVRTALQRGLDEEDQYIADIAAPLSVAGAQMAVPKLSKLASKVGDTVTDAGKSLQRSSIGVTRTDLKKVNKGLSTSYRSKLAREGENKLARATDELFDEGAVTTLSDPQDILNVTKMKTDALGSELDNILKQADEAIGSDVVEVEGLLGNRVRPANPVRPQTTNLSRVVAKAKGTEYADDASKLANKKVSALTKDSDGSLRYLQNKKRDIGELTYTDELGGKANELSVAWYKDLKTTIENKVDDLVESGKLDPKMKGEIKRINSKLSDYYDVQYILAREFERELGSDVMKELASKVRTSGGVFTGPALIGAGNGKGLVGGLIGATLTALGSRPGKRVLGASLKKIGKKLSRIPEIKTNPDLARAAARLVALGVYEEKNPGALQEQFGETPKRATPSGAVEAEGPVIDLGGDIPLFVDEQPADVDFASITEVQPWDELVQAVIQTESSGNPKAVSPAGAQGLMQLMPAMQKAFKVKDPFDPEENVRGGVALLNEELNRFKDVELALAAYNAGSPKINSAIRKAKAQGLDPEFENIKQFLPAETQNYVDKVFNAYVNLVG